MRSSLKVLLLAVILPGMLSLYVLGRLGAEERHDRRVVRVHVAEAVDADIEAELEAVALELEGLEVDIEAQVRQALAAAEMAEAISISVASANAASSAQCHHGREETLRLDADDLAELRVRAGSGALEVHGTPNVEGVVVEARMCASSADLLEGLTARLRRSGDAAELETDYPRSQRWGSRYARIDLVVRMPLGLAADIEDTSGELLLVGSGDARIEDSSGEIQVRGVNGRLAIRDGSGGITVRDIAGPVDIVDGSGELTVLDIGGDVQLTDGSGGIDIRGVDGSVHVGADGSGSIEVAEVTGDFRVDADGSGSITYSRVDGEVSIPRRSRR